MRAVQALHQVLRDLQILHGIREGQGQHEGDSPREVLLGTLNARCNDLSWPEETATPILAVLDAIEEELEDYGQACDPF